MIAKSTRSLKAEANGVSVQIVAPSNGPPADIDLILAGDVFYDPSVAAHMLPHLERCEAAGIAVLIGDPFRKPLPLHRLDIVWSSRIPDFGNREPVRAAVFRLANGPARPTYPAEVKR